MDDEKTVDLEPTEWKSERPKPYEPFFGTGLIDAIVYAIGFGSVWLIVRYFTTR